MSRSTIVRSSRVSWPMIRSSISLPERSARSRTTRGNREKSSSTGTIRRSSVVSRISRLTRSSDSSAWIQASTPGISRSPSRLSETTTSSPASPTRSSSCPASTRIRACRRGNEGEGAASVPCDGGAAAARAAGVLIGTLDGLAAGCRSRGLRRLSIRSLAACRWRRLLEPDGRCRRCLRRGGAPGRTGTSVPSGSKPADARARCLRRRTGMPRRVARATPRSSPGSSSVR